MGVQHSQENTYTLPPERTSYREHSTSATIAQEESTPPALYVVVAQECHLSSLKELAQQHKRELGFVNREILRKAIQARSVLVVPVGEEEPALLAGMVHFYIRRDNVVALYSIAVAEAYRRRGIGCLLFNELVNITRASGKTQIRLKCPADLPANLFYQRLGLELLTVEPGKRRPLNVWVYAVESEPSPKTSEEREE
jgi:ribosomal protein S18 acetylase RimI-like enzyme